MRRAVVTIFLAVLPAFAADQWLRLSTPEFELNTTATEKQARDTVQRFEQVREFFLQASPLRSQKDAPLRIFQFATAPQFQAFKLKTFASAFYTATPAADYIVISDRAFTDFGPSIHEYMHLIVRHSGLKLPTWLNEGWADVFSTLRPMGNEAAVGDLLPDRMKSLQTDTWLDFKTLTAVNQKSEIYNEASRVGIFYAESWALAHMLFLSPEYKGNFGKFINALQDGKDTAEAVRIAWDKSPDAVYRDLWNYFERKRLYGVVFETNLKNSSEAVPPVQLSDFDARLALADLMVAIGKPAEARAEYARMEGEMPDSADLDRSIGNLALWTKDRDTARRYFEKAYTAGTTDAILCFDLAMLNRDAKAQPEKIIPILERAVRLNPDFAEARVQLGIFRIEARDFQGAIAAYMAIPKISSQSAPAVYCGLAVARVETGDLAQAREDGQICRKWAKSDADINRAERVLKLVEARAKPEAAVRPGETVQRVIGIAHSLDCAPEGNRLQIVVGGNRVIAFDLPQPDAVEMPAVPATALAMKCGPLAPVQIGVEFAPPRSAMETSVGIVRRLEY